MKYNLSNYKTSCRYNLCDGDSNKEKSEKKIYIYININLFRVCDFLVL